MTFANVIVGADGRDGGRDALALAKTLCSGRMTLVSAYPADPTPSRASFAHYDQYLREDSEHALEQARLEAGVEADLLAVGDPSPARALHRAAEELGADLIVIGSAHHGPIGRLFLGDVARGVLHDAPCPVAVAPKSLQAASPRRIAVGYDGEAEAREALDLGSRLASDHGAALTVLVAWDDPPVPIAEGAYVDMQSVQEELQKRAEKTLADALAELPPSTAGEVLRGRPRPRARQGRGRLRRVAGRLAVLGTAQADRDRQHGQPARAPCSVPRGRGPAARRRSR